MFQIFQFISYQRHYKKIRHPSYNYHYSAILLTKTNQPGSILSNNLPKQDVSMIQLDHKAIDNVSDQERNI